jgi:hypothetical protein
MAYSLHIILGAVIFRVGSGVPFEALRFSLYESSVFIPSKMIDDLTISEVLEWLKAPQDVSSMPFGKHKGHPPWSSSRKIMWSGLRRA